MKQFYYMQLRSILRKCAAFQKYSLYGGGFGEAKGAMAPGPVFWQLKRGTAPKKKFKLNLRKTFEYTLCLLLMLGGT